jgi:exonuclease SbcC
LSAPEPKKKSLELLEAERGGLRLLSEEETAALQATLAEQTAAFAAADATLTQADTCLRWRQTLLSTEKTLENLGQERQDLQTRMDAFAPEAVRLVRAEKAEGLRPDFIALQQVRSQKTSLSKQITDKEAALETHMAERTACGQAHQAAQAEKDRIDAGTPAQRAAISAARALDQQISSQAATVQAERAQTQQLDKNAASLQRSLESSRQQLKKNRQDHAAAATLQAQHAADEDLPAQLPVWKIRLEEVQAAETQAETLRSQLQKLDKELKSAGKALESALTARQSATATAAETQEQWTALQNQLADLLKDRDPGSLREELASLQDRLARLNTLHELMVEQQAGQQSTAKTQAQVQKMSAKQKTDQEASEALRHRLDELQTLIDTLTENEQYQKLFRSLEEHRNHLKSGEPCPLCGATEHPFALEVPGDESETAKKLKEARKRLKQETEKANTLHEQLQEQQLELTRLQTHIKTQTAQSKKALAKIAQLHAELKLNADSTPEAVAGQVQELSDHCNALRETLKKLEALEKAEKSLRERRETAKNALHQAETQNQKAESAQQALQAKHNDLQAQAADQTEKLSQLREAIATMAAPLNLPDPLPAPADLLKQLQERAEAWTERAETLRQLDQAQKTLQVQIQEQEHSANELKSQQTELRKTLAASATVLEDLQKQRRQLLNGKSADEADTELQAAISRSDKALNEATRKLESKQTQVKALEDQIKELNEQLTEVTESLDEQTPVFLARLHLEGFADEADFSTALLEKDILTALRQQQQVLQAEKQRLQTLIDSAASTLDTEKAKALTPEDLPTLQRLYGEAKAARDTVLQSKNETQLRLRQDEENRNRSAELFTRITSQMHITQRWETLNKLIGSADGSKYQKFAQGLTFELMVCHANRQLAKITDRYLLYHDATQPLELQVIDGYQAGEIRTTQNLSGGESFLVSLALALGLSTMASHKVRVDSLFLDEGFGTLDPNALDTALSALAGLQQEGKMIGVISHVPALKERIRTQIHVTPRSGGISHLSGPGVRQGGASGEGGMG